MTQSLNLIPGSGKAFRDKDYWDKFFKVRGSKAFEWYGEYEHLCDVLHKYIKLKDNILVIGCGNSKLSENMYDIGIINIINIDLSEIVIKQMSGKNKHRKEMQFIKMDMLNMDFEDNSFDVVVDKGTLDALMSDSSEKVEDDCNKLFGELDRVLKIGGRYICVSLAQEHILDKILSSFKEKGWIMRVHRIDEHDLEFHLPVFVFVFTKMKMSISTSNPIIELKLELNNEKFVRYNSIEEVKVKIKEYQNYGLTKFFISNKNVDIQDDVFVHLYDSKNEKYPRYTIYIVDILTLVVNRSKMNGLFAVFVVPIGKEIEWLFGTKSGREELASQAKYQRLAVAHLNRGHTYESLDAIMNELSPKVSELAPKGMPANYKIPLLSLGPEVDVRKVRFAGSSEISGEFFVEDVIPSNEMEETRRLIFQGPVPLIQTEVVLKKETGKNKKKTLKPDYNVFIEDYFPTIVSQLCSVKLEKDQHLRILIVGLGGGALAMYCKKWLKNSEIDAVEIDEKIAKVAKDWFDLKEDEQIRVHIENGLTFIKEASKVGKQWDVVIIDINCNDHESNLWGPTAEFLEDDLLNQCKSILASPSGIYALNLICLDENLRTEILVKLSKKWKHVFANKLKKNRNEILFCSDQPSEQLFFKNALEQNFIQTQSKNDNAMKLFEQLQSNFKELKLE